MAYLIMGCSSSFDGLCSFCLDSSCPPRFSTTANQLLQNLKRRSGNLTSIESFVKHYP